MEKKYITEIIFQKQHDHNPIKFGEIEVGLQPDDEIISGYEDAFYTENNSCEGYFYLEVRRKRLETDEEFEKRKEDIEWHKKDARKRRYEQYIKLKKEFEE